jgi:hypothetical protein
MTRGLAIAVAGYGSAYLAYVAGGLSALLIFAGALAVFHGGYRLFAGEWFD